MRSTRTLLTTAVVAALLATGCEWHFETLDGEGGGHGATTDNVGRGAAVVYNGRPHVFHYNFSNGTLRHTYDNGSFWVSETLDGDGGTNGRTDDPLGNHVSAMLYNGRPHVFYYNFTADTLRHAYYNGSAWIFETLDGVGGRPGHTNDSVGAFSAPILYKGRPHIFYLGTGAAETLRHAYWNGIAWAFETLDGVGGRPGHTDNDVGGYNAAMLYNGRPHIFYYDNTDDSLRHTYWNGIAWAFEILDGTGSIVPGHTDVFAGQYTSAILYNGRPHVFHYGGPNGGLRHAYWNGIAWSVEVLDGVFGRPGSTNDTVGKYTSVVLSNGRPHVYYLNSDAGSLRHTYWNGVTWAFETLDGAGGPNGRTTNDVGNYNTAIIHNGEQHVFNYDRDAGSLRHTWFG